MAFSPPVVGCLVKEGLQRGGHGGTPGPPPPAMSLAEEYSKKRSASGCVTEVSKQVKI